MTETTVGITCCGVPWSETDCQSPNCSRLCCLTCGAGCDLDTPDGVCETVLAWSAAWSDNQTETIRDLLAGDDPLRLVLFLHLAMPEWLKDTCIAAQCAETAMDGAAA